MIGDRIIAKFGEIVYVLNHLDRYDCATNIAFWIHTNTHLHTTLIH